MKKQKNFLSFICLDVFHNSYKVYLFSFKHIYLLLLKVLSRRHVSALSGHHLGLIIRTGSITSSTFWDHNNPMQISIVIMYI
jgi:hypothetical protein